MKLDKTTESLLIFMAALVILITAYYVEEICVSNNVSLEYSGDLSLTGARLSDSVYATAQKVKEWKNARNNGIQFEITIYNNDKSVISNWIAQIDLPDDAELADFWNVGAEIKDGKLYLTPVDFNLTVTGGDNISFGFIINTVEQYYPKTIHLQGYRTFTNADTIYMKIIYLAFIIWAVLLIGFFVTRFNLRSYREKQKNDVKIILQSMNTFINFIDAKDPYTSGHSRRVAMYAAEIA